MRALRDYVPALVEVNGAINKDKSCVVSLYEVRYLNRVDTTSRCLLNEGPPSYPAYCRKNKIRQMEL